MAASLSCLVISGPRVTRKLSPRGYLSTGPFRSLSEDWSGFIRGGYRLRTVPGPTYFAFTTRWLRVEYSSGDCGEKRRRQNDAPPDFEKEFGFKETDTVTRIERQCGGDRIPVELETFGTLRRAPDYNPFQNLEIVSSGLASLPTPEQCEGLDYFTGMGMHQESKRRGMQEFRKLLNHQTNGNAARTMQRDGAFFSDGEENSISVSEIFETFRKSVIEQLSA